MNVVSNEALVGILEEMQDISFSKSFYSDSWFKSVMVYLTFALYSLLPITLLIFIFCIGVTKISILGCIIIVFGIYTLYSKAKIFWRDAYFSIGILCLISIFLKVALDFIGELGKLILIPNMEDEEEIE
jgi:hypothetical protein